MIKGNKIRLRAYKEEEAELVWKMIEEESIKENLQVGVNFPYSLNGEKEFVKSATNNTGELFNFAIENEEGKYIGGCGINNVDRKNSVSEIGLWLGKDFHGKGYGSDTLRTLCKFIFDEMNINKVSLGYFEFNEKGRRCYDAVGFKEEGVLRKSLYRYGKYHNRICMGLFRDELR